MTNSAFAPDGFYPFEGPATVSLELIPLLVRYKLDCAEVKLHLQQWQALSMDERKRLVRQVCTAVEGVHQYRTLLNEMIDRHYAVAATPRPLSDNEPWRELSRWPQAVMDQCQRQAIALPPVERWQSLSEIDRHALFVLGRSKHAHQEFIAAMRLFFGDGESVDPSLRRDEA